MIRNLFFIFFSVVFSWGAAADDARIRTEIYDPNKVFTVYTALGKSALVQFEDGETLDGAQTLLGMGDEKAWAVGVRGNNITFKPAGKKPDTNMLVVTNKRTYALELVTAAKNDTPTAILRFRYLDSEAAKAAAEAAEAKRVATAAEAPKPFINTAYSWRGDANSAYLKPTGARDDGRFTYFEYDHAGEIPVFYKLLPNDTEALLNFHVDGTNVVIHEVVRLVRARLGDAVIEIRNDHYAPPKFDSSGSTVSGVRRVEKEDK